MLSVVQMVQESEGSVGVRRREVGCQSDSAERRDAAVQVDLLTQQLNWRHCPGVLWQCVSVRADEPGGGALLQHCSSQETHTLNTEQHTHPSPPLYLLCSPLRHTLLPTMPLFRPPAPPAPQQPESKELQQTTWLPSMPQCEPRPLLPRADVSAPPPGLIAPLSPRLAEEEEEEEEEGSLERENNESLWSARQSTVTAEKKKKRRKSEWTKGGDHSCNMWGETSWLAKPMNYIAERVQPDVTTSSCTARHDSEMNDGERCRPTCRQDAIQSEDSSSIQTVRDETQRGETRQRCRKRGIQTGQPAAGIQRTRADGGENRTMVKEEEEKEEEEEEEKEKQKEKQLLGEEGGPKRRCTEEQRKDELMVKEEAEEEGRPRRTTVGPPIRYLVESEERSHGLSAANHSKAREATIKRKLGRLSREHQEEEEDEQERRGGMELTKRTDSSRKESPEDERVDAGWQLCQVCGLTFACRSPLQLHLSERRAGRRLSCRLCNEKFSCTNSLRLSLHRHHHSARAADDKQHEEGNANNDGERKETQERSKEDEEKTFLPASTKAPDWSRHRRRLCRNPRWWVDYRTTMKKRLDTERWRRRQERDGGRKRRTKRCREEEDRGEREKEGERRRRKDGGEEKEEEEKEEEKEVVEQPQRPRRKMVGPPIRYLLESEELSYGLLTANQDRAKGFKEGRKPQKKSKAGGGASGDTAMIDRLEDTEQTDRQTGHMVTERQTGHIVTEKEKTLLPASTKAPDWSRHRRRVCRNPRWWVDYQTTMKKRLDTERWRRRQERDGGRKRRTKRCREEEDRGEREKEGERRRRKDGGEEKEDEKEEEKDVVEQPQRPRRKMVGPPIRYLLESEDLSYGLLTANQDRAKGFKEGRKPQKKSKAGGGASGDTAVIGRPEDTEQTDRQTGHMVTERQTGHMITERQTGSYRWIYKVYTDLQSSQVTVIAPCCVRLQRLL